MEKNKKAKAKGGAEKERDRKKRRFMEEAKKCRSLDSMFVRTDQTYEDHLSRGESINLQSDPTSLREISDTEKSHGLQNEEEQEEEAANIDSTASYNKPPTFTDATLVTITQETQQESLRGRGIERRDNSKENYTEEYNFFMRPATNQLSMFFNYHPQVPTSEANIAFKIEKAFKRPNKNSRVWLTYSEIKKCLFCSVCLAFSAETETNVFTTGFSEWRHVYQRIDEHEKTAYHEKNCNAFFMFSKNKNIDRLLFTKLDDIRRKQIMNNGKVVDGVINVIKLIGKRGLAYRGKINEAAYTLEDEDIDHGNFLEIILLLSKYDSVLKTHLDKVIKHSKAQHEKGNKQRTGNFLTFLSKTTINSIISIIKNQIRRKICSEINEAIMYSVEIDTTQDISVTDQCSIIIRYLYKAKVYERLFSVVPCHDSTGLGFHNVISKTLLNYDLTIQNCIADSTDGASNMQGPYNGFSARMKNENPEHVHIWCYNHILNLVLSDILKANMKAASLFSLLNLIAVFFKESHKRMDIWHDTHMHSRNKILQVIGETRWWAKEAALVKFFGELNNPSAALYIDVVEALLTIENNNKILPDTRVMAKNYKDALLKYENIMTSQLFAMIFSITGPLSRYLQTQGLDLIKCNSMVQTALKELQVCQRDIARVENATKTFINWANNELDVRGIDANIEESFPQPRRRKVKRFFDEKCEDEPPKSEEENYRVSTFNVLMDVAVKSMENRFSRNMDLCRDLSLLDPKNFAEINTQRSLPSASIETLSKKILKFNSHATPENLKEEILDFATNWEKYKLSLEDTYKIKYLIDDDSESEEVEESEADGENSRKVERPEACKYCQNCVVCCYSIILKYNMFQGAYPALTTAYQYLLTLPISQVACERSFSILKYIKNRLRSRLSDENLESLMMMNIEKSLLREIENEQVINALAETSALLKKSLIY